jgi:hypothetical protein
LIVGEWDGAGTVVKTKLRNKQLKNPKRQLQNASNVVAFLEEMLSVRVHQYTTRKGRRHISRYFHEVSKEDLVIARTEPWDCATVDGTRNLHSISSLTAADPTQLLVCDMSCLCQSCLLQNWEQCLNNGHVLLWRLVKLRPRNTRVVRRVMIERVENDDESQFGGDEEALADGVSTGDNFAVLANEGNDEGVPYYIVQCQRPKLFVQTAFQCVWGNIFEVGEYAIEGFYYQRWGRGSRNYVYLSGSHPAYLHPDSVKAKGFPMVPKDHVVQGSDPTYTLLEEHHAMIMSSLEA